MNIYTFSEKFLAFKSSIGNFQIVIFHVVLLIKKDVNNELVTKALIFFEVFN